MNIPIELIVIVLLGAGAIVTVFWKAIETLKSGFSEIIIKLTEMQTANKYEAKEDIEKRILIEKKFDEHRTRIEKLESK